MGGEQASKLTALGRTLLAASLALVLTACSAPSPPTPSPQLTGPSSSSQPPSVGDVVVPDPSETPPSAWSTANRPYEMLDGTYILVSPREPLPAAVRADVEARLAAITPALSGASAAEAEAAWAAFSHLAAQVRNETGRPVIIIALTTVPSTGLPRWVHFGGTTRENILPYGDIPVEGIATAEEYGAKVFERSNESFFEVFYR